MSNLQQRVISAVILAIAVLVLTWFGGAAFRLLAALIGAAVFYEWTSMGRRPDDARPHRMLAAGLLLAVLGALVAGLSAMSVFGFLAIALALVAFDARYRGQGASTAVGFAYAALPAIALAFLRGGDAAGLFAILFLFATVWATDIIAYFVGRAVGGPKLAPSISPGKTWSGALGGTAGGIAAGMAVAGFVGSAGLFAFVVAALLSVVSQIGDLFESAVKRRRGVKDSSNLIPGHGGVMDRVDGLVAAAFALYVVALFLGGADRPAGVLF